MKEDKSINCTAQQLKEALQGHFTTEGMMLKPDDTASISGMVGINPVLIRGGRKGRWGGRGVWEGWGISIVLLNS